MFPIEKFQEIRTPFYYYDMQLLDATLQQIRSSMTEGMHLHYAVKACAQPAVLARIAGAGFGADCVSGGEIQAALNAGFPADSIVFAGVGKSDWEIEMALNAGISCFNVESIPELEVISGIAARMDMKAHVAFRINPNVGAHTHANITTGLAENKFGIDMQDMETVINMTRGMRNIHFTGLHFHIGSQILQMDDFAALCVRINELQDRLETAGIKDVTYINVGGGLGIDYQDPDHHPIPDFASYFDTYRHGLKLRAGQHLHFELGRAVVGQCGNLVSRVLYIKSNAIKNFCIVDAGMTDLIRPALYDAYHQIDNISAPDTDETMVYDVVGPICESSDVFVKDYHMPPTHRGDMLVFRSAGAYGEIMSSRYNCRQLPGSYTSEDI